MQQWGLGEGVTSSHRAPLFLAITRHSSRGALRTPCYIEPHDILIGALNALYSLLLPPPNEVLMRVQ